jgi:hypothetical protein
MNWSWSRCRKVRELLVEHVDRELTEELRRRVEAHLATCQACRQLARELEEGSAWAERARPAVPAEDFAARVMARIEQVRPAPSPAWGWVRPVAVPALALALVAAALVGVLLRPAPKPTGPSEIARIPRIESRTEPVRAPALSERAPVLIATVPALPRPQFNRPRAAGGLVASKPSAVVEASAEADELSYLLGERTVEVASYLEAGALYEQNGLLPHALSAYKRAAEEGEEVRVALLAMGRVHEQMGELDAAVEAYAAALQPEEAGPEGPVS